MREEQVGNDREICLCVCTIVCVASYVYTCLHTKEDDAVSDGMFLKSDLFHMSIAEIAHRKYW